MHTLYEFKQMIAAGGVTYPEPDVTNCGGVTIFRKIGALSEAHNLPLTSHGAPAGEGIVASQTPGISAVQLQRQLGLSRYETAFQLLHEPRAGMVRPDRDRIGGRANEHVEVDETWVGGRTRGEGRGVHHKTLVACAVEVRRRAPGTAQDARKDGEGPAQNFKEAPGRVGIGDPEQFLSLVDGDQDLRFGSADFRAQVPGETIERA